MALVVEDKQFTHMLRVMNTNLEGSTTVAYALTQIKGIGRRLANLVCKKADINLRKRAGELTEDELNTIKVILANPQQFNIPKWFLNRQKDPVNGTWSQILSNNIDTQLRDDIERMKKIRYATLLISRLCSALCLDVLSCFLCVFGPMVVMGQSKPPAFLPPRIRCVYTHLLLS